MYCKWRWILETNILTFMITNVWRPCQTPRCGKCLKYFFLLFNILKIFLRISGLNMHSKRHTRKAISEGVHHPPPWVSKWQIPTGQTTPRGRSQSGGHHTSPCPKSDVQRNGWDHHLHFQVRKTGRPNGSHCHPGLPVFLPTLKMFYVRFQSLISLDCQCLIAFPSSPPMVCLPVGKHQSREFTNDADDGGGGGCDTLGVISSWQSPRGCFQRNIAC